MSGRRTRAQTSGKRSGGGRIPGAAAAMAAAEDASSTASEIAFLPRDEAEAPKRRRVAPAAAWRRVMTSGGKGSNNNGAESSPIAEAAAAADCSPPLAATGEHSAPTVFQYSRSKPQPLMLEASAQGMAMKLGVDQFLAMTAVPALNEDYCNAFIGSYAKEIQSGIVKNQPVPLTGEAVASIVELPIGGSLVWKAGEVQDVTESLLAVFRALVERMGCSDVGAASTAALEATRSSEGQIFMRWSSHLADCMHRAVLLTREENAIFGCGRWLSGLIQKALGEAVTWEALDSSEQQLVVYHPLGAASIMEQPVLQSSTDDDDDDSDDDPVIRIGREYLAGEEAAADAGGTQQTNNADEINLTQHSLQEATVEDEAAATCEEKRMITGESTVKSDWSLKFSQFSSKASFMLQTAMEFEKEVEKMREESLLLNSELLTAKAKENEMEARTKALRLQAEKQQVELQKAKAEHDETAERSRQEAEDSRQKLRAMNEEMEKLRASKKMWTEEMLFRDLKLERLENDLASSKAMEKAREADLLQAKSQLMEVSERLCLAQNVEMVCKNQLEKIKAEHKDELVKVKDELEKQTSLRELWENSVQVQDNHRLATYKETYEAYVDLKQRFKELRSQNKELRKKYAPATPTK